MTATARNVTEKFRDAAEALACELADANAVECAWFLRGFTDRFADSPMDESASRDPNYGRFYRNGWNAGRVSL